MKLLLTSQGTVNNKVRDKMIALLPKDPSRCKLLFITTAANPIDNPEYMHRELKNLKNIGFKVDKFDLKGKTFNEIKKMVEASDVIFVVGGEPFYLLREVRKSGFDRVVKKLSEDKLYIGASAGTYIACPTVEMGLWKKPKRNVYGLKDLSGMGLVDFLVFAHHEKKWDKLIEEKIKKTKYKIYPLTDKQAILVDNEVLEFVNR